VSTSSAEDSPASGSSFAGSSVAAARTARLAGMHRQRGASLRPQWGHKSRPAGCRTYLEGRC
jgi:hypothetical protein